MQARMSDEEYRFYLSFLRKSEHYLELGSGGSTYEAARTVTQTVTSFDSSQEWLAKVAIACAGDECKVKPRLQYVDIGPVGDWGVPIDQSTRGRWPEYYESIWTDDANFECDLFLVDGRFRVASFLTILLGCRPDAVILVHDFASRHHYHVLREAAREIAFAGDLSAFVLSHKSSRRAITALCRDYRFDVR